MAARALSAGTGIDRDLAEITTSSIEAYRLYAAGVNLHEAGRDIEATAQLRQAVRIDPAFAMAWAKASITECPGYAPCDLASSMEDARQAFDHASRLPDRERFYIEGVYYGTSGIHSDVERSIDAFQKVLAIAPDHVSARQNLAVTFFMLDRMQEAVDHFETLRRRGVALTNSYSALAVAYEYLGASTKAIDVLQEYLRRNPDNSRVQRRLGDLFVDLGKIDDAQAAYDKAEALNPIEPGIKAGRRRIALLQDQFATVESADRARLASNDEVERQSARLDYAADQLRRGRAGDALKTLVAASAHAEAAALLLETNRAADAISEAEPMPHTSSTMNGPGALTDAWFLIARAQARLGHRAESARAIDEITRTADRIHSPYDQRRAWWLRGVIALDASDTDAAVAALSRAKSMLPPDPRERGIPIWFALGSAYLAASRDLQAAPLFQLIVDSPARGSVPLEFVRSLYFLAQIADRQGDRVKAATLYRRFLGLWGDGEIDRDRVANARLRLGLRPQ